MKKVLKLILVLAVISALCVSVFAASAQWRPLDASKVDIISSAQTDGSEDWEVTIGPADPAGVAANLEAAGETAGALESFDIVVKYRGNVMHSGIKVLVTLTGLSKYAGQTLTIYEYTDGVVTVLFSGVVAGDSLTLTITNYSTFTPVIGKAAAGAAPSQGAATSPRTSQSVVPYVLTAIAVLAFAGVLYANKQRRAA